MQGVSGDRFPAGHGEMARRVREYDWGTTPLGDIATWPVALRIAVDMILCSDFPQCLMWGWDLISIPNDAFLPILGAKPDALGRPWRDIWIEVWPHVQPYAEQALDGKPTFIEDFHAQVDRFGRLDDAWFTFCYSPVHDETGRVVGVVDTVVETTAKIRAMQVHADNEARLNLMLELLQAQRETADPDAIMARACQAVATHLKANRVGFYEVETGDTVVFTHGYGDEALAPLEGRWPAHQLGKQYLGALMAGETIFVSDTWADPRTTDSRFDLIGARATIGSPVLRSGHWVAGMYVNHATPRPWRAEDVALVRDVVQHTWDSIERARSSRAVRELNESLERQVAERTSQFDQVWRNSLDIQVVLDREGVFRAVSPAWHAILGRDPAEAIGRHFGDFVWPDDLETAVSGFEAVLNGAAGYRARFCHIDGTVRWISWRISVEDGAIYAYGRDITAEREQAEALRQAQKMEAVGQLTGGIAHDFNNMLAVISGSLDLLGRRVGDDARARGFVAAASEAARRAAALTQRLLAFSRRQPLNPEPTDVNRLVVGMSELLRRSLGAVVVLDTALQDGLWCVSVDPNQLENAILNLGVNARDAMPEGGRLTIATRNSALKGKDSKDVPAGDWVAITVTDTGEGMAPDVIQRAFDPFFTTKAPGKGTGLGLSQVYSFVAESGGHIRIASEPGRGTSVSIYLPRVDAEATDRAVAADDHEIPAGDAQELILVVDDEPAVRQFSGDALAELGYRVLDADGAVNALKIIDAHPEISLLFTDIVMPETNGRKLAQAAKILRPELKVLFTTGYPRDALHAAGGTIDDDVQLLGKPFSIEQLAAKVREVLDSK